MPYATGAFAAAYGFRTQDGVVHAAVQQTTAAMPHAPLALSFTEDTLELSGTPAS